MSRLIEQARAQVNAGNPSEAERLLRRELHERAARLLLARLANEAGMGAVAAAQVRVLTAQDPGDAEAWSALGYAAILEGHPREARAALERAVALKADYAAAHRNLAAVLCDAELSEEALASAALAERHGAAGPAVARLRARALIQLDRFDEAETLLLSTLHTNRADAQAQSLLARLRQLRADPDPLRDFTTAARAASATPPMRVAYCDALRRVDPAAAETELRALLREAGPVPALRAALATVLIELGDAHEAFAVVAGAVDAAPGDAAIAESFAVAAIASARAEAALPVVERFAAARPRDQRWITHRIDIARLRAESGFESWFDPPVVTRAVDLGAPSLELVAAIESLHRQRAHPLDQSLRRGTQTSRNLLVRPAPAVDALLRQFAASANDYLREIDAAIAAIAGHPLAARAAGDAELVGCWSVRLGSGGFHVNHIHPEGCVSSAFYLSVPAESADTARRSGWLQFGEPRHPVPGLTPTGFVQPAPGRLVLFPSYLWHGTTALNANEPRLTVAFDALPSSELR